jgi:energy-coupling factor transporter ATP-binding protein EcfA2
MNTIEVTIQRKQGDGWPVIVTQTRSGDFLPIRSDGILKLDLDQLEKNLLRPKEYGKLLGQALFQDDLRDAFTRASSEARSSKDACLRVLLFIEAEDLRDQRWERLCAPMDGGWSFLSGNQQTPFSLYLPSLTDRRFPPIGRRDLRALVLVAGPEDLGGDYSLGSFDIPATVASVRSSLGTIPCDVLASVEGAVGSPTLDALCERLTAEHYTLLHIVCHGQFRGKDGETILYFPDNTHRPVKATTLIERLSQLGSARGLPHLAFLSTCSSASPQAENGLGGLGQRLVRELGMPAVVAMTDVVTIATAEALASAFYARLREHGEADRALAEACAGSLGRADITVPALFSRLGDRPLFSDTLDRPLTVTEIAFGLERLSTLLTERAPILLPEFQGHAEKVRATLKADVEALSPEVRSERETALAAVNQLCGEVCDLSFNALALGQEPPPYDARPPFRGLFPFRREDQEFFFGREALVEKLVRKIKEHRFLAVLGPSGSGKSSLVLAGLIPALDAPLVYLTPNSDPNAQLEVALRNSRRNSVVVVDQLEELFTLCASGELRQLFIDRLLKLSETQRVVVTMRADFWGEVAPYPALREAMQNHLELVAPMDATELRRAMDMQASHVGLRFEADLSQGILDDVQGEPGAMPLLQHALLLLWNRRHGRWLRAEEYRLMGGIRQAIARTADEVYESLTDFERERMRDIFIRLTRLDEHGASTGEQRDTRRRVGMAELVPAGSDPAITARLVKRLADARLVVTSVNAATRQEEVEVAHEALIRYWPRLRGWLDEDRLSLRLREGIREAALEWEAGKRDDSLLVHRAGRLEDAVELSKQPRISLNVLEQDYLNACVAMRERERLAVERRRRRILYASIIAAVLMMILSCYGLTQARLATNNANQANNALLTATIAQGMALDQASTADAAQRTSDANARGAQTQAAAAKTAQGEALLQGNIAATEGANAVNKAATATYAQGEAQNQAAYAAAQAALAAAQAATATYAQGQAQNSAAAAVASAKTAKANEIAGLALRYLNQGELSLAYLLSAQAYKMAPDSPQTRNAIWSTLQSSPNQYGFLLSPQILQANSLTQNPVSLINFNLKLTNHTSLQKQGTSPNFIPEYLAISPDGRLAASNATGTILIWNILTRQVITTLQVSPQTTVTDIDMDSSLLAVGTADGRVLLWQCSSSSCSYQGSEQTNSKVNSVSLDNNGMLAASTENNGVYIWKNCSSGGCVDLTVLTIDIGPDQNVPVSNVKLAPFGKSFSGFNLLAGTSSGYVRFYDCSDTSCANVDPPTVRFEDSLGSAITGIAFEKNAFAIGSSSGTSIVCGSGFDCSSIQTSSVIDVSFGSNGRPIIQTNEGLTWESCSYFPRGGYYSCDSNTANQISFQNGNGFAFGQGCLLASGSNAGEIYLWKLPGSRCFNSSDITQQILVSSDDNVKQLAFGSDNIIAAGVFNTIGHDESAIFWDCNDSSCNQLQFGAGLGSLSYDIAFNNNGLFAGSYYSSILHEVRISTSAGCNATSNCSNVYTFVNETTSTISTLDFGAANLLGGANNDTVFLWQCNNSGCTDPPQTLAIPFSISTNEDIAISSGNMVALASGMNIGLWNCSSINNCHYISILTTASEINMIKFGPGNKLMAGTSNGILIWNCTSTACSSMSDIGVSDSVENVAFFQGTIIAYSTHGGEVMLWDYVANLPVGSSLVYSDLSSLPFSVVTNNSQNLIAFGQSKAITVWRFEPNTWEAMACQIASRNFTKAEWTYYFPGDTYQVTCPQWPAGK